MHGKGKRRSEQLKHCFASEPLRLFQIAPAIVRTCRCVAGVTGPSRLANAFTAAANALLAKVTAQDPSHGEIHPHVIEMSVTEKFNDILEKGKRG